MRTGKGSGYGAASSFTVRCLSADGKSYTSAYDAAGVSIRYLAMPEIGKLSNTGGSIKVTWSEVTGAAKYRLYCKVGSGTWSRLVTTTGTSYTVKGLSSGVAYDFTVRSCGKDGTLSGYDDGKKTMLFTNSPLVSYTQISPNRDTDRNNIIDTITIHCTAVEWSIEQLGQSFAPTSRKASSNYGVGSDGRIGMYVEEKDRSWCSSDRLNDNRAITIEVTSTAQEPYSVTDKALAATIDLVTDICTRNGIERLIWSTNKNERVNHLNGCNMTVHRDYANKSCPGTYLYERMGQIAAAVNARLAAVGG